MQETIYELVYPFKYANKGETIDAGFITLFAPTYKSMQHFAPIKQAFTLALKEVSEGAEDTGEEVKEEAEEGIKPNQIMPIFYQSTVDIKPVFVHAQELFKAGTAKVDGESPLTIPLMEKMRFDDFEGLVALYISDFIVPSLMSGGE